MQHDELIERLKQLQLLSETDHCEFLSARGFSKIVEEFNKIKKHYACL